MFALSRESHFFSKKLLFSGEHNSFSLLMKLFVFISYLSPQSK